MKRNTLIEHKEVVVVCEENDMLVWVIMLY
jgi:hypothetical protein